MLIELTYPMERAMSGEPENLILVYLRRLDDKMDRLAAMVVDIETLVTSVEAKFAQLAASVSDLHGNFAAQSQRLDRIEARLDRIERRLDIAPA